MASIRKKLSGGQTFPQCNAEAVALEVLKKPALVEEAMGCLLDDDRTISGQAAYVMMRIGEERPNCCGLINICCSAKSPPSRSGSSATSFAR